jgi:SGNH hydrolase-like domain, acetyltransferase AlgX
VVKTLKNGELILFYGRDVATSRLRNRRMDADGFKAQATELGKHNLRLVVLLVPTKYTVYPTLLQDDDSNNTDPISYVNAVEKSLTDAGIAVVNLATLFGQKAQENYERNLYIYLLDDIHWNAKGIDLAAGEILKQKVLD